MKPPPRSGAGETAGSGPGMARRRRSASAIARAMNPFRIGPLVMWRLVSERLEESAVPRRRNTLARGVRPGLVRARADAELAPRADVPILPIGPVPEFL